MPRIFTLLAGLPKDILGPFIARLKKCDGNLNIVQTLPMSSSCYTPEYAEDLYRLAGSELRQIVGAERGDWWDINFVVLYVRKQDGGEHHVLKRFDMEALLVPLAMETARRKAPNRHYINTVINSLVSQSTLMLRNARAVLRFLAQEVTNRDTRTCVLLPEANFGAEFDSVKDCVHAAVTNPISAKTFDTQLKAVAGRLQKGSGGRFRNGRLVFRAPSKAGARHGMAPIWDTKGHTDRCVIRGHIRFGVPYSPKFHYDCGLARDSDRRFRSCHGEQELRRGRAHVNIAPNDNIR